MTRFGRDNQQDTGVGVMPTCARGVAGTVGIPEELRGLATDHVAKLDCGSRAYWFTLRCYRVLGTMFREEHLRAGLGRI